MEEATQTLSQTDIINIVTNVLNELFSNLLSSIDNTIYSLLDQITFLDSKDIIDSNIQSLFFSEKFNLLILANILLTGIVLYHIGKIILSIYTNTQTEFPYLYVIKVVIYGICMNCSLYILEGIINLNYLISEYLLELGKYLFKVDISFTSFTNIINNSINIDSSINIFSLDGVIHSMLSFGFISILITYILRFILIKILILCSPFMFLCLCEENLSKYFFNWLKYFIIILLNQNIVIIALYTPYILDFKNDMYSKFLIIGVIYTIHKINEYIKEFIGGFSISGNINLQGISSALFKGR